MQIIIKNSKSCERNIKLYLKEDLDKISKNISFIASSEENNDNSSSLVNDFNELRKVIKYYIKKYLKNIKKIEKRRKN